MDKRDKKEFVVFRVSRIDALGEIAKLDYMTARSKRASTQAWRESPGLMEDKSRKQMVPVASE